MVSVIPMQMGNSAAAFPPFRKGGEGGFFSSFPSSGLGIRSHIHWSGRGPGQCHPRPLYLSFPWRMLHFVCEFRESILKRAYRRDCGDRREIRGTSRRRNRYSVGAGLALPKKKGAASGAPTFAYIGFYCLKPQSVIPMQMGIYPILFLLFLSLFPSALSASSAVKRPFCIFSSLFFIFLCHIPRHFATNGSRADFYRPMFSKFLRGLPC
jgi:hypothetical protein